MTNKTLNKHRFEGNLHKYFVLVRENKNFVVIKKTLYSINNKKDAYEKNELLETA